MRRLLVVFMLFASLLALACGVEIALLLSARVEQVAFLLVPSVFMISSLIGLSTYKQL